MNKGWKIVIVEILVSLLIYFIIAASTTPIQMFGGYTFSWANLWFWSAVLYIGLSFRYWMPVKADTIGVRTIFGQPVGTVLPGLPIVPPGIGAIEILPGTTRQKEGPAEPEKIFRGEEGVAIPEGMRPPLRITFGVSLTAETSPLVLGEYYSVTRSDGKILTFNPAVPDDALSTSRVTAEVSFINRWRIHDAVAFYTQIGPSEATGSRVDEADRQMEDEMVIIFNSIYPRISAAQAAQNVEWMNLILFNALERRIGANNGHSEKWGIDLEGASVNKPTGFNHALNKSISGVAEASFTAIATVTAAEAAAKATVLTGAATATAAKALGRETLAGKGMGIAAAAKSTGLTPAEIIGAETAQAVGKGDGTIIVGADGVAQLAGIAAAFAPKPATQKP